MSTRFIELRKSPRIEINAPAKIIMISRGLRIREVLPCKILNISEGGALIVAATPITESEFYLETSNKPGGLHLCAVVRHETECKVGVRFVQDQSAAG